MRPIAKQSSIESYAKFRTVSPKVARIKDRRCKVCDVQINLNVSSCKDCKGFFESNFGKKLDCTDPEKRKACPIDKTLQGCHYCWFLKCHRARLRHTRQNNVVGKAMKKSHTIVLSPSSPEASSETEENLGCISSPLRETPDSVLFDYEPVLPDLNLPLVVRDEDFVSQNFDSRDCESTPGLMCESVHGDSPVSPLSMTSESSFGGDDMDDTDNTDDVDDLEDIEDIDDIDEIDDTDDTEDTYNPDDTDDMDDIDNIDDIDNPDDTGYSSDTSMDDGKDTSDWLVNFIKKALSEPDEDEIDTFPFSNLDEHELLDQKRRKFRIRVDECLAEALATVDSVRNNSSLNKVNNLFYSLAVLHTPMSPVAKKIAKQDVADKMMARKKTAPTKFDPQSKTQVEKTAPEPSRRSRARKSSDDGRKRAE
ncbi:hypothetical protein CAEBREN_02772 [Caenorhabditis brenneri]|uniref:Nuclear receptor domain-containing protein n=1 Tax=Caenorhabditis brenneri TaxID=135651 RepID=G0NQF5_CAEBE|nr:hypothetical protein CAEBREN_02772 [Caenorhabditis brenneri]